MPVNREEILEALFQFVSGSPIWSTKDRRLAHWSKTPGQPAIFVRPFEEEAIPPASFGINPNTEMTAQIWIYCQNGDGPASTNLTDLMDLIDALFTAYLTTDGRQTLGGLVFHAWREGRTIVATGEPQSQSVAVMPIRMLVRDLIVPRAKALGTVATGAPASIITGDVLPLSVVFNVGVTIAGGVPVLQLNSGGTAALLPAPPARGTTFQFDYTVGAGDTATLLSVTGIELNGATVVDQYGKTADLTLVAGALPQAIAVNPPGA
jgi:hypothetical protein